MNKRRFLITSLIFFLLLGGSFPISAKAAYDDVQAGATAHIILPVDSSAYILTNYTKVESFTVNNSSIDFVMLSGSTFELSSIDKKNFSYTTTANSCIVEITCSAYSTILARCPSGSATLTVTPLSTTCSQSSSSGGGTSGSSSGGTSSPDPSPAPTPSPTPTTPSPAPTPSPTPSPAVATPPAMDSEPTFTTLLKMGSSGNMVRLLQEKLQDMGFFPASIAPTGYFGPVTAQSVKKFQTSQKISPVGYLGPATREALNNGESSVALSVPSPAEPASAPSEAAFTTLLKLGSSGNMVRLLQEKLQDMGFFPSTIEPTGFFGPITVQSVKKFQIDQGISSVGYLGPATREALNNN